MATGLQNQERVPENQLRKQLSVAVRSIQWSYAIFWSISTKQQGILEWRDGYYNGDIKTMKTVQPIEHNVDKLCLKRSEELRELYESLSDGDSNQQAKRPSVSLSPEDLSDAEWYYLVCMSFTFNLGVGLPGRAYTSGEHIWLSNASYTDSKFFLRSLLAKSASIQTVLCFPFFGGVIELGSTELVIEDLNLLQHIKSIFLEFPLPICSEKSLSNPWDAHNDEDPIHVEIDHEALDTTAIEELDPLEEVPCICSFSVPPYIPKEEIEFCQNGIRYLHADLCEDQKSDSLNCSPNGSEPNHHTEDSFMLEGEELSNCVHGSTSSSDCISQTFLKPGEPTLSPQRERVTNKIPLDDLQDCYHREVSSLDLSTHDLHYTRTLSVILKNSNQLIAGAGLCSYSGNHRTKFSRWKKGDSIGQKPPIATPQNILKKILFNVTRMHSGASLKYRKENGQVDGPFKPEGEDIGVSCFLLETKKKVNEQFLILRSLVPSTKFDNASILGDTIEYLKDLERRVEELESCRELTEIEAKGRRKHPDIVERTSANYGNNDISKGKTPPLNKRKACNVDEIDMEFNSVVPKDSPATEVTVCKKENEVMIEMHCPWTECLLLEIMDAISNLQLDPHSVQSSTSNGVLTLILTTKFRGAGLISAGAIKLAILRVIG